MTELMRVRAISTGWGGAAGLNTFYFVRNALTTDLEEAAELVLDRVHAAFDDIKQVYNSAWRLNVIGQVDILHDDDGETVDTVAALNRAEISGTNATAFGPTNTALLCQLRTSTYLSGRRLAGRVFLGPVVGINTTGGDPHPSIISAVDAFGTALRDAGNPSNPHLVVWRRPRVFNPPKQPLEDRPGTNGEVTGIGTYPHWATLRSRRD